MLLLCHCCIQNTVFITNSIILGLIDPSSNFIDGMVDQLSISVPIKEEPGSNYILECLHSKINNLIFIV